MTKMSKITPTSGKPMIVFFGSGPVAAASLACLADHFEVEAVITKTVPPHHREPAPVETLAKARNLTTYFANNKQELDSLIGERNPRSQLGVIVDFGVIVSQATIDSFPLGILNAHFSLLPRWRGADPISFSILAGDAKTGVSLMLIEPSLDTGKVIVQKSLAIHEDDTTPSLTEKLIALSNELLVTYIPLHLGGETHPRQQPHPDRVTFSRKLSKVDGIIDWNKPAVTIEREIRAYIEWPKSHTMIADKEVIITKAHTDTDDISQPLKAGMTNVKQKQLTVGTGDGILVIDRLKPAGKKEMTAAAFLAGYGHLFS